MGGFEGVVNNHQTLDSEQKPSSISKSCFFYPWRLWILLKIKTLKTVYCRTSYLQATSCDHCTFSNTLCILCILCTRGSGEDPAFMYTWTYKQALIGVTGKTDTKTNQRIDLCLHHILTQMGQVTSNSTNLLQFQHIHLRKRQCMYPALRQWQVWDNFTKIKVPEEEGTLTSGWSVSVLFGWVIVIYTLRLWEALEMKRNQVNGQIKSTSLMRL